MVSDTVSTPRHASSSLPHLHRKDRNIHNCSRRERLVHTPRRTPSEETECSKKETSGWQTGETQPETATAKASPRNARPHDTKTKCAARPRQQKKPLPADHGGSSAGMGKTQKPPLLHPRRRAPHRGIGQRTEAPPTHCAPRKQRTHRDPAIGRRLDSRHHPARTRRPTPPHRQEQRARPRGGPRKNENATPQDDDHHP